MAVNDDLLSATIRHEIGLRRYSGATVRKIIALLNCVDARLVKELQNRQIGDGRFTERRLELLLDAVRTITTEAYNAVTSGFDTELRGLAKYEAGYQVEMLSRTVPIAIDFVTPSAPQLYAAVNSRPFQGRLLKDWYKDLDAGSFKRVRDTIRMGYVEGQTNDQIVRAIRGTRAAQFKDGILEANRRSTEAVVRTAINHTANTARGEVYKANSSAIKGVQWVSTLDGRTSAVCRGRDGQIFDVDKGPRPPAHINCRSTTVPVMKSWQELGINLSEFPQSTRASRNGQVAGDLTYSGWLRTQPKDFQNEVLGVTKAKLFRDGKVDLDRFVDRAGNELTLDQLKAKEAAGWAKAGLG